MIRYDIDLSLFGVATARRHLIERRSAGAVRVRLLRRGRAADRTARARGQRRARTQRCRCAARRALSNYRTFGFASPYVRAVWPCHYEWALLHFRRLERPRRRRCEFAGAVVDSVGVSRANPRRLRRDASGRAGVLGTCSRRRDFLTLTEEYQHAPATPGNRRLQIVLRSARSSPSTRASPPSSARTGAARATSPTPSRGCSANRAPRASAATRWRTSSSTAATPASPRARPKCAPARRMSAEAPQLAERIGAERPLGRATVTATVTARHGHATATASSSDARRRSRSRRLYRSGESEYLIDGEICRLRDVHELLMDTGLGAKAYAIIEQGKIGLILSSRPADRRQLIEEAAGITKYKAGGAPRSSSSKPRSRTSPASTTSSSRSRSSGAR